MSARKRGLAEISQGRAPTSGFGSATPKSRNFQTPQANTIAQRQPLHRYGNILANQPGSARNVLRRLARATATTTKRRVTTPTNTIRDKENVVPFHGDEDIKDDRLTKPVIGFNIEESIEEDDSDLPVAPTPSALLDASDDEDIEQPTVTFLDITQARSAALHNEEFSLLHSDPALPAREDDSHHDSTYLSERGRRALSEDPTRVSRYSFGSIRMSDFGSELEIRRASDRQQKLADLEAEDDYGGEAVSDLYLGGETELLRGLSEAPVITEDLDEEPEEAGGDSFNVAFDQDESLQPHEPPFEVIEVNAAQTISSRDQPQIADITFEYQGDPIQVGAGEITNEMLQPEHELSESRHHTLLESMIATAAEKKPRRKQKLNQRGNMVPGLPSSLMKRIIHDSQEEANKRRTAFGKDHIKALEQATEWFFEQASQDLDAYSSHGRRKKRIDANDVLLLMRRQRVLKGKGELRKMAKDWLPRELLNELNLPDQL